MAKEGLMRRGNVLGKIQPSERYYEVAFVFGCVNRIRLWRDDHLAALIGASGMRHSNWLMT